MDSSTPPPASPAPGSFDTGSHQSFYEYYKRYSESPATLQRFAAIRDVVLRMRGDAGNAPTLRVLDVGCNAGTQGRFWSESGHAYTGIDINAPLVELARDRAIAEGREARFEVGSATELPFADASFDVCLLPELLEHIQDWEACLREAVRVVAPGGSIYISTSNWLCPRQQEFNLPGYSWYPAFVKHHIERRAVTDWPAVANYAKYPAVHWFSFYQLQRWLGARGFRSWDRFDVMRLDNKPGWARAAVKALRVLPPLRFAGHVLTPATILVAQRR